jgi:hypothetical protein
MASGTTPISSRPRTVTIASYLIYAQAALSVVSALIQLALVDDFKVAAGAASPSPTAGTDAVSDMRFFVFMSISTTVLVLALGWFCGRGGRRARVIVWLVGVGGLLDLPIVAQTLTSHGFFSGKPDWYPALWFTSAALVSLGMLTASILLALPISRPFFRKPAPTPTPATTTPSASVIT